MFSPMIHPWLAISLALPGLASQEQESPRLIVLVSVDQMIPEQLRRLRPWLEGGLQRFLEAEVWERARLAHGVSDTGPGHATLASGVHPARHGVIANTWMAAEDGATVYCAGDPGARALGPDGVLENTPAASPANLLAATLAEYVKRANPGALAVGIAGKDRAATLATGKEADWAFWWDMAGRGFTSSNWYGDRLPRWVMQWNRGWVEEASGFTWEDQHAGKLSGSGTEPDDRPGEPPGRATLPHRAPRVQSEADRRPLAGWVFNSPLIDAFTLELATKAVDELKLGADGSVDYLFIGLSGCDTTGHLYGPYSHEVTDVLLRADRALEAFFQHLDERVGKNRWVAALSADHGVLELPESLRERGIPARRISLGAAGKLVGELQSTMKEVFGEDLLLRLGWRGLRFSHQRMRAAEVDPRDVEELAASMFEEADWMERVFTRTDFSNWRESNKSSDPLLDLMARSYHPQRSADLTFVFKPWTLFHPYGTSHGSPWPYDRRVPLAFLGPGHRPGKHYEPCATVDVCPTLLSRAGLTVPEDLDGQVLP